jgi:hypothetical protein
MSCHLSETGKIELGKQEISQITTESRLRVFVSHKCFVRRTLRETPSKSRYFFVKSLILQVRVGGGVPLNFRFRRSNLYRLFIINILREIPSKTRYFFVKSLILQDRGKFFLFAPTNIRLAEKVLFWLFLSAHLINPPNKATMDNHEAHRARSGRKTGL